MLNVVVDEYMSVGVYVHFKICESLGTFIVCVLNRVSSKCLMWADSF